MNKIHIAVLGAIVVCLSILLPFASSNPDGFEKVAASFGVQDTSGWRGLLPEYSSSGISSSYASMVLAGVFGVCIVAGAGFILGKALTKNKPQ